MHIEEFSDKFSSFITTSPTLGSIATRETREGWPLLNVETEVNGDSKRANKRVPLLVGSLKLFVLVQEIFVLPWLQYSALYRIFLSSPYTISIPLSPLPSKLGREPCWVACLLVYGSYSNTGARSSIRIQF